MTRIETAVSSAWLENNQKYLAACIEQVRFRLQAYTNSNSARNSEEARLDDAKRDDDVKKNNSNSNNNQYYYQNISNSVQSESPQWPEKGSLPAIELLSNFFGLSSFERFIILLCAGVELFSDFARLCAQVQGIGSTIVYPTFGLALSLFPDAHWSAISAISPLRYYKIIEFANPRESGGGPLATLASSPIRIDERILHYLTGISYIEPNLQRMIEPVREINIPFHIDSHRLIVEQILCTFKTSGSKFLPVINLWGADDVSKKIVAQHICTDLHLTLWQVSSPESVFLKSTEDVEFFRQLWIRESLLQGIGLYISLEELDLPQQKLIVRLIEDIVSHGGAFRPIFLSTRDRLTNELIPAVEVRKPSKSEQLSLWMSLFFDNKDLSLSAFPSSSSTPSSSTTTSSSSPLGCPSSQEFQQEIMKVVDEFDLDASSILSASHEVSTMISQNSNLDLVKAVWNASLSITRSKIAQLDLVQHVTSESTMDDLILPEQEKQLLRDIAIHVRQRSKVYERWGFGSASRGIGIVALFCGASGTGKTMAAEVLANELRLDLYRIDLSSIVNKYIGETEKNLRKVFDACENGGAVLFFDEADALFGKRTEVRDSHDRYANIEVNYLLQRIESYRGLAILATNMKSAIDSAFMRRIKFIIDFSFPDEKHREEIWNHIFPKSVAIDNNSVDFSRLARLNITGANIRNIAIYAAFLAADEGIPISMKHIKRAVQVEYAKTDRPLIRDELLSGEG